MKIAAFGANHADFGHRSARPPHAPTRRKLSGKLRRIAAMRRLPDDFGGKRAERFRRR